MLTYVVVEVRGPLDLHTASRWEHDVDEAIRSSAAVVVDLSPVEFVDSAGVRALFRMIRTAESAATSAVVVAPATRPVSRLLQILDLEALVPITESRDEALRALRSQAERRVRRPSASRSFGARQSAASAALVVSGRCSPQEPGGGRAPGAYRALGRVGMSSW